MTGSSSYAAITTKTAPGSTIPDKGSSAVNASLTAQQHGLGLLCLKFGVHVFPFVFGEVGVGHYQRADGILHVHAALDVNKPSLLQSCIQFVSSKKVPILHGAMQTSKTIFTTSNFSKLITFLHIIKEKP